MSYQSSTRKAALQSSHFYQCSHRFACLPTPQYVKIHVGPRSAQTRVIKHELNPEWNEVFAFNKAPGSGSDQNHIDRETGLLELSVWDEVRILDDFSSCFSGLSTISL